jgi:hypothetical protein
MDTPFTPTRIRNHGAIWMVSLLVAGALTGVAYFLFAEFEHSSWFGSDMRRFLNHNEAWFFPALGLGFWLVTAMLFYRFGTFSRPAQAEGAWGSGPDMVPSARGRKPFSGAGAAPAPAAGGGFVQAGGGQTGYPVVIVKNKRACTGDLFLTSQRLYFVCYRDESAVKANAGKAVAHQFGLLGVLIHALATKGKGKQRETDLEQIKAEVADLPLDDRITRNEYSFGMAPNDITRIQKSTWTGKRIEAGGIKYVFTAIEPAALQALGAWAIGHGIESKGF